MTDVVTAPAAPTLPTNTTLPVTPPVTPTAATEPAVTATPTRPAVASRKARRGRNEGRGVTRYTLDLETQQHKFLRMFAIARDTESSKVMRTLLYLLEADSTLQRRVEQELFAEDDAEVNYTAES